MQQQAVELVHWVAIAGAKFGITVLLIILAQQFIQAAPFIGLTLAAQRMCLRITGSQGLQLVKWESVQSTQE